MSTPLTQELMTGKASQTGGETPTLKSSGTGHNLFFNNLSQIGLLKLQELISTRQQLIDNLPKELQNVVRRLITDQFHANQIDEAGFRALALASKTIAKEIQHISTVLQQSGEVLPAEIQKEWASISYQAKEKVMNALTELSGSFLKAEKSLDIPHTSGNLAFFLPLYFEEKGKPYPAFIHIYSDQENENPAHSAFKKEIWLRICFLTENLGPVETVFCLRDGNLVIRIAGTEIQEALDTEDICNSLKDLELPIGYITVKSG